MAYAQFFLFGDSITQDSYSQQQGFGFSAALQAAYIRRLDVVNRGFSGYNTRQAVRILPAVVPPPEQAKIRFFMIFFGANDACLIDAPHKQHVPIAEYRSNLEKIITHPQVAAHDPRIILVAPPPVNEHLWWPRDQARGCSKVMRTASTTKEYADAACEVGDKLGVPVVNLWKSFMTAADFAPTAWQAGDPLPGSLDAPPNGALTELMYDGLHFNPKGYELFFQEVMKLIANQWPDQLPEKLSMTFPPWDNESAWKEWESNRDMMG